ncbi:MAG: gamma-glutamyl-gamma-aminobutyrate hydrolase family protein, partial [Candidatus Omnitrophica bacterium]|nr:gamma-glutamyl-gamma-aminobutyrate hydrolase family protein [Candidatus Omnitrophota bacterium]
VYELDVPILGICYGAQLIAQQLPGGFVSNTGVGEYGRTDLEVVQHGVVFGGGQPAHQQVWMSHFDSISTAPDGFTVTATTAQTPVAAMEHVERRIHAVQFHPEVVHTPHGQAVIEHFLYDVCGCPPAWTMGSVIDTQVELIREQVGSARVICALSGGVDSAVAAALVHKAVGPQLTCVFVDTGL